MPYDRTTNHDQTPKKYTTQGGVSNEDHPMAICMLPDHQMPSDIKLCLAFLMFRHENV
jgi:hypothetical protein